MRLEMTGETTAEWRSRFILLRGKKEGNWPEGQNESAVLKTMEAFISESTFVGLHTEEAF